MNPQTVQASDRTLIVEDNPDTRELLSELLNDEGHIVDTARDGDEALAYLKTHPVPKLIILDLTLPKTTGAEVLQALNLRADRNLTKVLVCSGWDDLHIKSKTLGADGYLRKPYDIKSIHSSIARLYS